MRTNLGHFAAVVLFWGLAASSGSAADASSSSVAPKAKPTSTKERLLGEFDLNHDGKLDTAERQAARTALAKRRRLARSASDAAIASAAGSAAPGNGSGYGSQPYDYSSQTTPYASNGYFYSFGAGGAMSTQTTTATGQGAGMGGQCTQMGMQTGSMGGRR